MATPQVLIDGSGTRRNIEKMAAIAERNGVALRPHVKTQKIPAIARAQVEAGAVGITLRPEARARRSATTAVDPATISGVVTTCDPASAPWRAAGRFCTNAGR